MNKREKQDFVRLMSTLESLGFTYDEAEKLRRISIRLHGWHEKECGDGNGCIERDETTGKPYFRSSHAGQHRWLIRDDEKGALKRLDAIMKQHAPLAYYIQGDPRGAALYILRPGDVPKGQSADSYYTRGICVY